MLGRLSGTQPAPTRPSTPDQKPPTDAKPEQDTTSGLLRAKKRARQRMEQDDAPPDDR